MLQKIKNELCQHVLKGDPALEFQRNLYRRIHGSLATYLYMRKISRSYSRQAQAAPGLLGQESRLSLREPPEALAQRLLKWDVISSDIFDTLVCRYLDKPDDLFYIVGQRLGSMNFHLYRMEAEERAWEKALNREATLEENDRELEGLRGLDPEAGTAAQLQAERDFLFPNPYLLRVCQELVKHHKAARDCPVV